MYTLLLYQCVYYIISSTDDDALRIYNNIRENECGLKSKEFVIKLIYYIQLNITRLYSNNIMFLF